ncbi:S-adenosyl-L-methionine-dependent methyltransferase [Nemania sp. FL0031]|nr:S-adenosyl-L-methionine-dependent methyltransferase [Nemania sp. FL0031]
MRWCEKLIRSDSHRHLGCIAMAQKRGYCRNEVHAAHTSTQTLAIIFNETLSLHKSCSEMAFSSHHLSLRMGLEKRNSGQLTGIVTQQTNTAATPVYKRNMSQNIYDQREFFENYIKLDRQTKGLDGAPEWPRLRAMLPDLKGARVLDLGCGFGWFSRFARSEGAAHVHGIDLSAKMLDKARSMTCDDAIIYEEADLDDLTLPEAEYDVVFSSLAFHYLALLPSLMAEISRSLKRGGRLVFSVEHPLFTAPTTPSMVTEETGRKVWLVDAYQREGVRMRTWFVEGVRKQHRTMGSYINMLLNSGLRLTDFVEWCPSEEELASNPGWDVELVRPTFLLMGAKKD